MWEAIKGDNIKETIRRVRWTPKTHTALNIHILRCFDCLSLWLSWHLHSSQSSLDFALVCPYLSHFCLFVVFFCPYLSFFFCPFSLHLSLVLTYELFPYWCLPQVTHSDLYSFLGRGWGTIFLPFSNLPCVFSLYIWLCIYLDSFLSNCYFAASEHSESVSKNTSGMFTSTNLKTHLIKETDTT